MITDNPFRVRVLSDSRDQEVTVIGGGDDFFLMAANGGHTRFMPFDLHLATSADFNEIVNIDDPIVGPYGKLCSILVNIVTAHILPMFSADVDVAFRNIPQAEHLSAAIDQLLGVLGKPDHLCGRFRPYYFLNHGATPGVVEEDFVVAVVDVEVFATGGQPGRLGGRLQLNAQLHGHQLHIIDAHCVIDHDQENALVLAHTDVPDARGGFHLVQGLHQFQQPSQVLPKNDYIYYTAVTENYVSYFQARPVFGRSRSPVQIDGGMGQK